MRFNPKARLDSGQVSDGGGGGGLGGGGMRLPIPGGAKAGGGLGGIVIIILFVVLTQCLGGGGPTAGGLDPRSCRTPAATPAATTTARAARTPTTVRTAPGSRWSTRSRTTGTASSAGREHRYEMTETHTFTGQTSTGCGAASSQVGPFYCPADDTVYLDTGFFDEVLEQQLGAPGRRLRRGVRDRPRVRPPHPGPHRHDGQGPHPAGREQRRRPARAAGRLLRRHVGPQATAPRTRRQVLISELTDEDIRLAIEAAESVGDDRIQKKATGRVNPESWTHGSAEQRQRWFIDRLPVRRLRRLRHLSASTL